MFNKINQLVKNICEAGGVDVELTEPINRDEKKQIDPDEEEEDDIDEELFSKEVHHGEVITRRNTLGKLDKVSDLNNRANLVKARLKSKTPQANLAKKHSMLVRKRKVDGER